MSEQLPAVCFVGEMYESDSGCVYRCYELNKWTELVPKEEKDMASESCPECGCPNRQHRASDVVGLHFKPNNFRDKCPCPRTYESLTQIDKQRCKHCGLLGDWSDVPKIGNMTREIDSRNQALTRCMIKNAQNKYRSVQEALHAT